MNDDDLPVPNSVAFPPKLSIILATRKRPGLLVRNVQETLKHITLPDTRLVIAADDDDFGTLSLQDMLNDPRIIWSIKPREDSVGAKYNRVMTVAPADVYMVMVDYAPCYTPGFDAKILEAAQVYPDGYAVILNHLANMSFSQLNAVTHKLAVRLGGIYPEYFPYWFVDHWLEEMARRIGRQVFVDVLMDCSRKQPTMEKKEPNLWGFFFTLLDHERAALADAIIDSPDFNETPERKVALKRNYTLWREWSEYINRSLVNETGEQVSEDDERYHRLRKPAMALIQQAIDADAERKKREAA